MLSLVLEMLLDNGRMISNANECIHYVIIGRGNVRGHRTMEGSWWSSTVIRPLVRMMKEDRAVEHVRYVMKVSDTGSVYHWLELT